MNDNATTLALAKGQRLRTGGTTYEVTKEARVAAGMVPVKPQSTRLLKTECASCGYNCRVTKRWIDKSGAPICPECNLTMTVAGKGEAHVAPAVVAAPPAPPAPKVPEPEPVEVAAVEFEPLDLEEYLVEVEDEPVEVAPVAPLADVSPLAQLLSELPTAD